MLNLAEPKRKPAALFVPMVKLFYQDEYATIELDESIPCVRLKLDGLPRYSEHYQFVQTKRLELMHQAIKNHKLLHMLTDSRTAGPVLGEDVIYFKEKVMPEMDRAGVRFLAIVMPSSFFTRMTIQEMTENSGVVEVRYFDSLRDAREWLKSKSPELL